MHPKYKILIPLLVAAILVMAIYSYVYVFADIQAYSHIQDLKASDDYKGISIDSPPQSLTLWYEDESIIISPETLETWYESYNRDYTDKRAVRPKTENIVNYLEKTAFGIDTQPINAKLDYKDGKIIEFVAPQKGKILNIAESATNINSALLTSSTSVNLVIDLVDPEITLEKANSLGIDTLLGRGESDFDGSSTSRIHNIKIASRLFNGLLIKPNEEFSFNKILGNVDATGGYETELVIKNGGTVKEYGGGICQVSTTLFRSAIYAGLPITERKPHTLLVRYYDQPGFDSTVYPGVTDLKFINDTGNNILMQPRISGTKIYFDIYGTNDDRKIVVNKPHQYATGADGSVKTVFTRTVKLPSAESVRTDTFYSSYKIAKQNPTLHNPLE